MANRFLQVLWTLALLALLPGCEPLARHQALTTFFDEVPVLPPMEQYCREAAEKKEQTLLAASMRKDKAQPDKSESSIHLPYGEKRCNGCHQSDKTSVSGLIKPATELCFVCHGNILKSRFAHGPAAEGECVACHLPHEARYPSLLIMEPAKLCGKCHSERRSAASMHDKIRDSGVMCLDCHDPHSGETKYFLK